MKSIRLIGLIGLISLTGCATQMVNDEGTDFSLYGRVVDWLKDWHKSDAELAEPQDEPAAEAEPVDAVDIVDTPETVVGAAPVEWIADDGGKAVVVVPYEAQSVEVWRDRQFVNGGIRDGDRWRFDLAGHNFAGMQLRVETAEGLAWYDIGDGKDGTLQ